MISLLRGYKLRKVLRSNKEIQNYIILCVLSGKFIPPRRSKDYVDFKIKDIDPEKDNYINKKKSLLNLAFQDINTEPN